MIRGESQTCFGIVPPRSKNKCDSNSNREVSRFLKLEERRRFKKESKLYKNALAIENNSWLKLKVDTDSANGLPTLKVDFSQNCIEKGLVDTGSSVNLISDKMLLNLRSKKIVKEIHESNVECKSANNTSVKILGYCKVKIKIYRYSWYVKFHIAKSLTWNVILGSEFIKKSGMVIDLNNDCCSFKFDPVNKIEFECNVSNVVCNVNTKVQVGMHKATNDVIKLIEEFPNVFTNKIGAALDYEIDLKLKDTTPVYLKTYPMSPPRMSAMKDIINDLLEQDIIRPSLSQYASPTFLIKRPNSEKFRLVINYSQLNNKIEKVNYPIGDCNQVCQYLQGCEYFTVLDLCNSFHQIRLTEKSKHITAFTTPFSSYEWNRIPYGLHLGSGVLSSYLNKVFDDIKFKFVINFVDDLIVFSKSYEQHIKDLREVVSRLSKHNLTVNPQKAKFVYKEIKYLGYLISKDSICIDPDRTQAIRDCPVPRDAKEVARYIGMVSYFSNFIQNFSDIASPLNELRKKNKKFVWSDECQASFVKLKNCIVNPPVLAVPDYNKPFILYCDASDKACGSCLMQNVDNKLKPIAFYSRKFNEAERCLSVYEKEALSIVCSINKFRSYLEVQEYKLKTDNSALAWVLSNFRKMNKIGRWCEIILSLPFTIEHVKGSDNKVADYLSRIFATVNESEQIQLSNIVNIPQPHVKCKVNRLYVCENKEVSKTESINSITDFPIAFSDFKTHQQSDNDIQQIITSVKKDEHQLCYYLNKGVLMYRKNNNSSPKIYLPSNLLDMVFKYFHNSMAGSHMGIYKTVQRITQYFYRPNLANEIKQKVKDCDLCYQGKPASKIYNGPLVSSYSHNVMDKLYIDIFGPLTRGKGMNKNLLIVLDDYSKYVWTVPIRDATSFSILKALENVVFKNFSLCKEIVSDNAKYFTSAQFKNFLFNRGIIHKTITPYVPRSNKSERYLRNLKSIFQIYFHENQTSWDTKLCEIQIAMNSAVNESINCSPFEVMFQRKPNLVLTNLWKLNELLNSEVGSRDIASKLSKIVDSLKKAIHKNRSREMYSKQNSQHPFKKGSIVFVKTYSLSDKSKQFMQKMALRYDGPYRIIYFITDVTCLVQKLNDLNVVRRCHISQLKIKK